MNTYKKTAIIVGALILIAYAVMASEVLESLIIVVLLEVISGVAVIAIAVLMYPILKPYNEKVTLWYAIFKVIEGVLIVIAGILLLSPDPLLLGIRDWINVSHVYISFIPAALLFYYLLYISKLVPRFISVWGVIALISLLIGNLLEITGYSNPIFYLLIVSNEVFLAIWLIVKGFNSSAIASESA
jgi:hypothetical protein